MLLSFVLLALIPAVSGEDKCVSVINNSKHDKINWDSCQYSITLYHLQNQQGDGIVAVSEKCDDGNVESGDGCSSKCVIEDLWDCTHANDTTSDVCVPLIRDRTSCLPSRDVNVKYKRVCYQENAALYDTFYAISWIAYAGLLVLVLYW